MRRLARSIPAVRPRSAIAALLAAGALGAVAGCGSGDDSWRSTGGATSGATTAASTPVTQATTTASAGGTDTSQSVTDYAAYVGGSGKADASKSPVYIGWVNQEGGQETIGA